MAKAKEGEEEGARPTIDRASVVETAARIQRFIRKTPVIEIDPADFGLPPMRLFLKLEQLQRSGSFKVRGAFANLLSRKVPQAGVVAASGGNHGAAVAFAAKALGVRATIFVPTISSPAKIARIRDCGAELVVGGDAYADALAASDDFRHRMGAVSVHAFDQPETILGQGTLALELESQAPALDAVLVSVGGGGLASGVATGLGGRAHLIAVEPEASPTLARALDAGRPVDAPVGGLAADSLAPRRVGSFVFPILRERVSRVVLVSDEEIRAAQKALWNQARLVAEPGGATAFAALLAGKFVPRPGERIAVIISGGNTTAVDFGS
jgi:threonine dehydratase